MKHSVEGQSLIEFAVSVSVLIALLVSIPIIAKIANVNVMSIQALDYAAWRAREGNVDNSKLTQEVNDRYFGETALIVDDEKINHQGAQLGTGKDNEQIYRSNTVTVNYNADNSKMSKGASRGLWNHMDDDYKLGLYNKKGTLSINVPLENLNVIPEIADSITITKSVYIDNQTLSARDQREIQNNMDDFKSIILPYNNGAQKKLLNEPTNLAIETLRVIPLDVFQDYRLRDVTVNHEEVPDDRLTEFAP